MFSIITAEIRLDSIDSIINWNIIQEEDIQINQNDQNQRFYYIVMMKDKN